MSFGLKYRPLYKSPNSARIKRMKTRILSVATTVPANSYSQEELVRLLNVQHEKALRFFRHGHIHRRHLIFPTDQQNGLPIKEETPAELRHKFLVNAVPLIREAIEQALTKAQISKDQVAFLSCVTSTGFLVPGLSALIIEDMRLNPSCQRLDIVGMGCNAGLNGLNSVASWCKANPEKFALLVCCELCSCIYSIDENENTSLVNSLFGDGVAVSVVKLTAGEPKSLIPSIEKFHSFVIPDSLPHLRFNFEADRSRYSFHVDKKTPETLAAEVETPLAALLSSAGLKKTDIKHWILHTGGDAILNGIEKKLALPEGTLRHTRSVLRDHGNVSSGSFLFSYDRLLKENIVQKGDYGIMMTMGPGLTIELALLHW